MFEKFWDHVLPPLAMLAVGAVIGANFGRAQPQADVSLFIMLLTFFTVVAVTYRMRMVEQAQDPKTPLSPGRWTVITVVERYEHTYMLALKRHVAFGYWRYRLADIPHGILIGPVVKGDELVVRRRALKYDVQPA